jgi:uncharacterized membrane protein
MAGFIALGIIAALAGLVILVTAIRNQGKREPKYAAMLIGGMMLTAFGIIIAGFAIAYRLSAPLNLNAGAGR